MGRFGEKDAEDVVTTGGDCLDGHIDGGVQNGLIQIHDEGKFSRGQKAALLISFDPFSLLMTRGVMQSDC